MNVHWNPTNKIAQFSEILWDLKFFVISNSLKLHKAHPHKSSQALQRSRAVHWVFRPVINLLAPDLHRWGGIINGWLCPGRVTVGHTVVLPGGSTTCRSSPVWGCADSCSCCLHVIQPDAISSLFCGRAGRRSAFSLSSSSFCLDLTPLGLLPLFLLLRDIPSM